ncbi:MAG: hypothetical protein AB7Q29_11940 [Vicinamibacterales bacterium]
MASVLCVVASPAYAQQPAVNTSAASEEIEPRIVGTTGTTMVGVSGFFDRASSSEDLYPNNFTLQGDVTRFLTRRIAVTGGIAGMSSAGEGAGDQRTGPGALALHAFGGALYFLTPRSIASLYLGGSYWAQLTRRDGPDAGTVVGLTGLQATVSSRAAFYVEGGYGLSLTKGSEGEAVTRILGRVGVRLKF